MKLLAQASDGTVYPVTIDADGHLQVDVLNLAEDDENNLLIPLADGGRQLIVRPDHDEKLFGFEDTWFYSERINPAGAGNNYFFGDVVDPGYMLVVNSLLMFDNTNNTTVQYLGVYIDATPMYLGGVATQIKQTMTNVSCNILLGPGDKVFGLMGGVIADDDIYFHAMGYIFKIP